MPRSAGAKGSKGRTAARVITQRPRRQRSHWQWRPLVLVLVPLLAWLATYDGGTALLAYHRLAYDPDSAAADHLTHGERLLNANDADGARAAFVAAARFAPGSAAAHAAAGEALAQHADHLSVALVTGDGGSTSEADVRAAVEHARQALETALDLAGTAGNARATAAMPTLMRATAGTTAQVEGYRAAIAEAEAKGEGLPLFEANKLQAALKNVRGGYGRFHEAIALLQRMTAAAPRSDFTFFNLGQSLTALNRYEESALAMKRVTQLAPQDWEAFDKLGDACREHGEHGAVCGDGAAARAMEAAQGGGRRQNFLGRMLMRHGLELRRVVVAGSGEDEAQWARSTAALEKALATADSGARGPFERPRMLVALGGTPSLEQAQAELRRWCDNAPAAPPLPPRDAAEPSAARLAMTVRGAEARFAALTCTALLTEAADELELARTAEAHPDGGQPRRVHAFAVDRLYRDNFRPSALVRLKDEAEVAVLGALTAERAAPPTAAQARDIAVAYSTTAVAHLTVPLTTAELIDMELSAATADTAYRVLEESGVVVFSGALTAEEVGTMARFVDNVAFHQPEFPIAAIKNPALRFYPLLTLAQAQPLLGRIVGLLKPLLDAVVGADAALCELGVIAADPGSAGQAMHVDTAPRWGELEQGRQAGVLLSVFVTLADVAFDQGAFEAWPGSHRNLMNVDQSFASHRADDGVRFAVPGGTIYAYTSSLVHRGRANEYHKRRANFMFSVVRRNEDEDGAADTAGGSYVMAQGSTFAMLPAYGSREKGFTKSLRDLLL